MKRLVELLETLFLNTKECSLFLLPFSIDDRSVFLCYPYYRFAASFDNKDFLIIVSDNKIVNCYPYYRFAASFDNKDSNFRRWW